MSSHRHRYSKRELPGSLHVDYVMSVSDLGLIPGTNRWEVLRAFLNRGEGRAERLVEAREGFLILQSISGRPNTGAIYIYRENLGAFFWLSFGEREDDLSGEDFQNALRIHRLMHFVADRRRRWHRGRRRGHAACRASAACDEYRDRPRLPEVNDNHMTTLLRIDAETLPRLLVFDPPMTDEEFEALCRENDNVQFERTKEGAIRMKRPASGWTSSGNEEISNQLGNWWRVHKLGRVFDATGGFRLPDGSTLSPDASYLSEKRLKKLPKGALRGFPKVCPDFVIELLSESDTLKGLKSKMADWISNGAVLVAHRPV